MLGHVQNDVNSKYVVCFLYFISSCLQAVVPKLKTEHYNFFTKWTFYILFI